MLLVAPLTPFNSRRRLASNNRYWTPLNDQTKDYCPLATNVFSLPKGVVNVIFFLDYPRKKIIANLAGTGATTGLTKIVSNFKLFKY